MKKKENAVDLGYNFAGELVKAWNSHPNPPPVYVNGNRIHHGYLGVLSTVGGFVGLLLSALSEDYKERSAIANVFGLLIGAGVRLMEDDIADVNDWFNFENNQNNQIQFPSTNGYNEFV